MRTADPHDGEFIAAEAHDDVGRVRAAAQAGGDLAQQLVAHRMAARVVDLLEAVQIDQQHQRALALPRRRKHALEQDIGEIAPVAQTRQRILQRLFGKALAQQVIGEHQARGEPRTDDQRQHDRQHHLLQQKEIGQRQLRLERMGHHDGHRSRCTEADQRDPSRASRS